MFKQLRELLEELERVLDGINSFKVILNRHNPDELLAKIENAKGMLAKLEEFEKQADASLRPPTG